MSKWIRGIYNAAANFNMRNALQSANGRTMGRNRQHVREELNKSDECIESSQSSQPRSGTFTATPTATASSGTPTSSSSGTGIINKSDIVIIHSFIGKSAIRECNDVNDAIEREYNDYLEHTSSTAERQRVSTRVRACNESGYFKQTNADATDRIEQCTGIPTGVTI